MKGKDFKKIIKCSDFTVVELSIRSEIPEQTIFSLYKKEKVEDYYIDKLKEVDPKMFAAFQTPVVPSAPVEPKRHGDILRVLLRAKGQNQELFADKLGRPCKK